MSSPSPPARPRAVRTFKARGNSHSDENGKSARGKTDVPQKDKASKEAGKQMLGKFLEASKERPVGEEKERAKEGVLRDRGSKAVHPTFKQPAVPAKPKPKAFQVFRDPAQPTNPSIAAPLPIPKATSKPRASNKPNQNSDDLDLELSSDPFDDTEDPEKLSYKSFAKGLARFVSLHENSISTDGEKERDKSFVGGALLDSDDFAAPSVEGSASGQTVDSFISNLADLDISASSHTVRLAKTRDSIMLARKKGVKARDSMELTRKKGVGKIEKMKPSKTSKNETKPLKDSNAKKPGVSKPSSKRGADQVAPKPPKTPHPIPSDPEMDELVFAKAELAVLGAKTANGQTRARSSNGRDAKTVGGKQRANTRGR